MRSAQLNAILWLRWRLFRNQWSRGGVLNQIFSILVAIGSIILVVSSGVGGLIVGAIALKTARADTLLLVWHGVSCGFLFFWMVSLMIELQRTEVIDLTRFLHLPVSLRGIFAMNYLASHLSLSLLVFVPGMIGLALGLGYSRGPAYLLLLPVVAALIFLVTAWTYYLRGWLGSLMSNPRRRRSVIVAFSLVMMLLFQAPNLYFNLMRKRDKPRPPTRQQQQLQPQTQSPQTAETPRPNPHHNRRGPQPEFLAVHPFIPPFWPGHAAFKTAHGTAWPALPYSVAGMMFGLLGLGLSYRSTLRFYRGYSKPRPTPAPTPTPVDSPRRTRPLLVERAPPLLPPQTAALALACFRSLSRAPEVRMFLGTNFIVLTVFGALLLVRLDSFPAVAHPFLVTAAVGATFFGFLQILINQFGFDRDGFRALILLPIPRPQTLLAKNLAVLPFAFSLALFFSVLVLCFTQFSIPLLLAAVFQFLTAFLLLNIAGNALSILVPYRIEPGSMRQNKVSSSTTLITFATHLLFPFLAGPIVFAPLAGLVMDKLGFLPANWTNLIVSFLLALLAAGVYAFSLPKLGRLLQTREQDVLLKVTREME